MLPIQNPKVETIISLLNEIEVDGETILIIGSRESVKIVALTVNKNNREKHK